MAGVSGRFSFTTAAEKLLKQRKHRKKHCFLVVGLEKVAFREGNCQGNRKLRTERSNAEIKNDDFISSENFRKLGFHFTAPIRTAFENCRVVDSKDNFVAFKTLMSIIFQAEYSIAFSLFIFCSSIIGKARKYIGNIF